MFGIYTFMDVIKLIGMVAFSVGFYTFVLRPMRLYAKDCENFKKNLKEEVLA